MKKFITLLLLVISTMVHAQLTYHIDESVLNSPKRDKIIKSMDSCMATYNRYSNYTKHVKVIYSSGIPTANASYNGRIAFGGSTGHKTAMHELSHVLGVGTYWKWNNKVGKQWLVDTVYTDNDNYTLDSVQIKWAGDSARAMLKEFNGPDAKVGCDKSHFWPYGLNYDKENYHHHVYMVGAFRYDMGLSNTSGQGTGYMHFKVKAELVDSDSESGAIKLTWSGIVPLDSGVIIERSVDGGDFIVLDSIKENFIDSSYTDTNIVYGKYKYRIRRGVDRSNAHPYSWAWVINNLREGDTNIALNKPVTADYQSTEYPAVKLTDGDIKDNTSRWVTDGENPLPHWVEIDLQGNCDISRLKWFNGWSGYSKPLNDFKFQYWENDEWKDALDVTGNTSAKYEGTFPAVTTDKVRLYITKTFDGKIRLFEIEVYGKQLTSTKLADREIEPSYALYPNPANNMIFLNGLTKEEEINIFNLSGRKIKTINTNKNIDLSDLNQGVYFLTIKDKTLKFIKK